MGQVVRMYPRLTNLTEGLRNVYTNKKKSEGQFTPNQLLYNQWRIDVNFIKRLRLQLMLRLLQVFYCKS
jgi:hypothetical protein